MLKIYVRDSAGNEYIAFHWTRDANSGVSRAFTDAKRYGIEIVSAWAV